MDQRRRVSTARLASLAEARRNIAAAEEPNAIMALAAGRSEAEVAEAYGLPPARVHGLVTFYEHLGVASQLGASVETAVFSCTGTSCTFPHGRGAEGRPEGHAGEAHAVCLGRCYAPPATSRGSAPIPWRTLDTEAVILAPLLEDTPTGALYALPEREVILDRLEASGLRGRGGAGFPTAKKWRTAAAASAAAGDARVVANGDEGDPGAFIDRLLLEETPHAVLAGIVACAQVIGASEAVLYIRGEYPEARRRVEAAIAEAEANGWLGALAVRVVVGAGSFVCGEETALLRSIEGMRGEPWVKPPYPAIEGLEGLPTVVQNIETLALAGQLIRHGGRATTKAFCVAGALARPGVVEAPWGTTLRRLLDEGAGGPRPGQRWKMAVVGGPMGRVLPASAFDVPLSYEGLPGLGHGGIVVLDESVSIRALAEHLFAFASGESCGNCTPCRVGTRQLAGMRDADAMERLLRTMEIGSLCGFGKTVPTPIRDLIALYGQEVFHVDH